MSYPTVYALFRDPNAESWTTAGRWTLLGLYEYYDEALDDVPENLRDAVDRDESPYYKITEWTVQR